MQNIAEFHIIGRIGKIDTAKEVSHVSVAANYNRRDGDGWKSDPHWNRVAVFGKLRDRLAPADKGDLVSLTGRVRQSSYDAEGQTRYTIDMIADGFAILAKASGKPADEERGLLAWRRPWAAAITRGRSGALVGEQAGHPARGKCRGEGDMQRLFRAC